MFRKQLKTDHITKRTFQYSKRNTNLSFTLNLDKRDELKDFKELLEEALVDIEAELERDNN